MRPRPDELAAVPLFESLSEEELDAIASLTDVSEAEPGATLVGEGDPGHALLVLLAGTASVATGGEPVRKLERGDFFGEIALLTDGRRTATVTADSPARVLTMGGSDFRVFERDWPQAAQRLRASAAERLERTSGSG
jgi:CRP-like cAMP-binding protein